MLQYLPGFGSVTAGGADDGTPVNDFTEEPGEALSPQMRLQAVSPRSAAMCSQRARLGMSPALSPQSHGSSPVVFDSPASASPTRLLQAERQYWAELTGRQVQELHEALQIKSDACLVAVEKLKKEVLERLRQDVASIRNEFATLLNSLEQRLRREHQTDLQAAMEAARLDLPSNTSTKAGEGARARSALEMAGGAASKPTSQAGNVDLPMSASKLRQLDGLVEEIGLRVDGLHVKLEEDLTAALADERKTRGKAISDVCQYIEHVVALQESDAKSEKRQTDAAVAGLEDRVQVLEVAFNDCIFRSDASSVIPKQVQPGLPAGDDETTDFPSTTFRSDIPTALSPAGFVPSDADCETQASNSAGFTLFSEEMRESLKHIVRKVGNTMSKDSERCYDPNLGSAASTASTRLLAAAPPAHTSVGPAALGPCQGQASEFGGPAVVQTQMWFTPNGRQ